MVVADNNMVEEVVFAKNGMKFDHIRPLLGRETGIEEVSVTNKEVVSYFVPRVILIRTESCCSIYSSLFYISSSEGCIIPIVIVWHDVWVITVWAGEVAIPRWTR